MGLVAVVRAFLEPCQELLRGSAPVRGPGEEEELLGVPAGEQSSRGVEVGDAGHLVDAGAARRAGSGEDHLAHELRLLLRDDLGDHAAHGEPEEVDLIEAEGTDEGDGVPRHLLDGRRRGPAGGTDTSVVEGDDPMLRGDAVDDSGVPVVQDRCQVGEEDHRHPRARAELTVGELHPADVDRVRRRVPPRGFKSRLRGLLELRHRFVSSCVQRRLCIMVIIQDYDHNANRPVRGAPRSRSRPVSTMSSG